MAKVAEQSGFLIAGLLPQSCAATTTGVWVCIKPDVRQYFPAAFAFIARRMRKDHGDIGDVI